MKQEELRIGNHILIDGKEEMQVLWVKYNKVCIIPFEKHKSPAAVVDIDRVSGILITEDKLTKIGFECGYKSSMHSVYYFNDISYYFWYDKPRQYLELNALKTKIDNIHQLQNLYFALTNEELTLTE